MADKIKVFANKEFTNTDIGADGSIELITNDANTQAVITDFEVEEKTKKNSLEYYVANGDFAILSRLNTASGSEKVDANGTLKLVTDLDIASNNVILDYTEPVDSTIVKNTFVGSLISSTTSVDYATRAQDTITYKYLNDVKDSLYKDVSIGYKDLSELKQKYPYTVTPVNNNFSALNLVTYSTQTMSNPAWFYIHNGHAFYFSWDGNSTTQLYTAEVTATNVGTWNAVDTNSYSFKVLDIDSNKVYYENDNVLYSYNLTSRATPDSLGALGAPSNSSSYTCACVCNDVFFYTLSSGYENFIRYRNLTTGENGQINVSSNFNLSSRSSIAVAYNESEDKWYIDVGYGNERYIYTTTGAMSGTKSANSIGNQFMLPFTLDQDQGIIQGDKEGRMLYKCQSSSGVSAGWAIVKWDNNKATLVGNSGYSFSVDYQTPVAMDRFFSYMTTYEVSPASQNVVLDINEDTRPFNVKLKISGVETKEEL
jgi:hypothetical protein